PQRAARHPCRTPPVPKARAPHHARGGYSVDSWARACRRRSRSKTPRSRPRPRSGQKRSRPSRGRRPSRPRRHSGEARRRPGSRASLLPPPRSWSPPLLQAFERREEAQALLGPEERNLVAVGAAGEAVIGVGQGEDRERRPAVLVEGTAAKKHAPG